MKTNTCCFFGHRTINETEKLKARLHDIVERLIVDDHVDTLSEQSAEGILSFGAMASRRPI